MEVGDWITLSAVLVALGLGVAAIIHTRIMQIKERKERLLNDIIEWSNKGISLCALHKIRNKPGLAETKYLRITELLSLYYKKDAILALAKRIDSRLSLHVNDAFKALKEYLGGDRGIGVLHLVGEHEGEEISRINPELVDNFEKTFSRPLKLASQIKAQLE
jgi:hypothetical protein